VCIGLGLARGLLWCGVDDSASGGEGVEDYDLVHRAWVDSSLLSLLEAESMGSWYPSEVDPFRCGSWWLLGQLVAGLRCSPGSTMLATVVKAGQ